MSRRRKHETTAHRKARHLKRLRAAEKRQLTHAAEVKRLGMLFLADATVYYRLIPLACRKAVQRAFGFAAHPHGRRA